MTRLAWGRLNLLSDSNLDHLEDKNNYKISWSLNYKSLPPLLPPAQPSSKPARKTMAEGTTCCTCNSYFFLVISLHLLLPTFHSLSPLLGVHPLDGNYFASQVIKCKDGSKSFTRDRLNDNFCDCVDGTDEPGTSACPRGRFYCRNLGNMPQFIHSSRVNDRICDCCDGSDEYDSAISCPNTCIMGGNSDYKTRNYVSTNQVKESKTEVNSDDLLHKIKGLRAILILQVVILGCVAIFRICYRCGRSKTRRHHHR